MAQLLRRPEVRYADLPSRDEALPEEVVQQVEIALKYEGYIARQEIEVAKIKSLEDYFPDLIYDDENILEFPPFDHVQTPMVFAPHPIVYTNREDGNYTVNLWNGG